MSEFQITDHVLMDEIGKRLAQRRIDASLTQSDLARQSGVGRSTVERLEAGRSTQVSSLVRVLRVLGLLEQFLDLFPDNAGPGPMDLLQQKRKVRKRVSSRKKSADNRKATWVWADKS